MASNLLWELSPLVMTLASTDVARHLRTDHEPAVGPATRLPSLPSRRCRRQQRPARVDIEAFAKNLARLIEEGGKALAAYMKPREEGRIKDRTYAEDITDVVQDPRPGRRILAVRSAADARCAVEPRPAYLDLWADAVKRMAGEKAAPVAPARSARQALCRPRMVEQPVLRFPQAGLSAHREVGQPAGGGRRRARPAHAPEGRVLRAADRQRDRALELRAHQPGTAARDARPRNAGNLVRGMHMLAEDIEAGGGDLKIRQSDSSRSKSAATSRSPPARSSIRTT